MKSLSFIKSVALLAFQNQVTVPTEPIFVTWVKATADA